MMYLFILGKDPILSRIEVNNFCEEVIFDEKNKLLLAENLNWENLRNLPKSREQIFLDRLGGIIRMSEVIEEFKSKQEMLEKISTFFQNDEKNTLYFGISSFGTKKDFNQEFGKSLEKMLKTKFSKKIRFENYKGQNLTSGEIFSRKLCKKGHEFIIWQRENSFLLTRTVANQNLRNYTLRDYEKPFRDAKMGMLPPKLAQILINLANPQEKEIIFDPFCGSGTIISESAIIGFKGFGNDLNEKYINGAKKNWQFLGQKFRFEENMGNFTVGDALKLNFDKVTKNFVIVSEGWLGHNFTKTPTREEIRENSEKVLRMWTTFFQNLEKFKNKPRKIIICLPCWNFGIEKISISQKLFTKIKNYEPSEIFQNQKSFIYARQGSFVNREIVVLEKI